MPEKIKLEELTDGVKTYLQTNIELFKLEATERTSVVGARLISSILVGITLLLFILFLSLSAGFLLGNYFNDLCTGFAIVTGFYFLLTLILLLFKNIIEKGMRNSIIRRLLSK